MKERLMNKKDINVFAIYIKRLMPVYLLVLALIMTAEILFFVRGLIYFNLEKHKNRLYLYSYLFLFASSLISFIIPIVLRKKENRMKYICAQAYIYSACLIVWSAFVSLIDCYGNSDSGVLVYVMVTIAVGVLLLVRPLYYVIIVTLTTILLLIGIMMAKDEPYSSGFYINFVSSMIIALFINFQIYRINVKAEKSSIILQELSFTDQLTGIFNRRQLDHQFSTLIDSKNKSLFMLIDIDNFKSINDTYGHNIGDECLITIANHLKKNFGDNVYRYGGDEFALIINKNEEEACKLINMINEELSTSTQDMDIHISAGIYRPKSGDKAIDIFMKTDKALYEAKTTGKKTCRVYKD